MPAAAVIRRGQALSGFTGCKGSVDGAASLSESRGLTRTALETAVLECRRGKWNSSVAVKCVDIRGTPVAKAAYWTVTDVEARKRGEQTGLDTLVVHAVNDEC